MDFDFKNYDMAEYVLKKNIKMFDQKTTDRYQRSADMFTLFCQLMGVDKICYPQGDIICLYDFFAWKSDMDAYEHVQYNEYPKEYKEKQLSFDNGMYLHTQWLNQIFYVAHPYREVNCDYGVDEEDKDLQLLNDLYDDYGCNFKILNPEYSWHNQYASSLYIVGTWDFMMKADNAIEAYKSLVDKYYADSLWFIEGWF